MVLEHTPSCLLRSGPGKRWHLARDALRVGEDGRRPAVSPGLLPRPPSQACRLHNPGPVHTTLASCGRSLGPMSQPLHPGEGWCHCGTAIQLKATDKKSYRIETPSNRQPLSLLHIHYTQ